MKSITEVYLHGAVIANIIVEVFCMLRVVMLVFVAFVLFQWALSKSTADFVCGGPHHLCVVTHFE